MLFIETSLFTKQIKELLVDDEYRLLQEELVAQPDKGDLIKNGGGIRVIYYWVDSANRIYFLIAYPKSVKDTLTDKETEILRKLVKQEFNDER